MYWVTKASFIEGYKLKITFNDGIEDIIDFFPIINNDNRKIVKELLDKDIFQNFVINIDTVCWANGVDFAPEFLYEEILKARHVA